MIENKNYKKFWTSGNGKDFLKWSGISATDIESTDDTTLFYEYDEECDTLVREWMKRGVFGQIMQSLSDTSVDVRLPEDFTDFKNELCRKPEWVNRDLIKAGSELSQRSGLTALLVLRDFALLGGYYFVNLTKPLVATGALEKGPVHRLYNTLNFWVEVSRTHASADEMRIDACLKTRLIHSASRLMIEKKYPEWDLKRYGTPINHADMIATSLAFSFYFLYGLDKLNFSFSPKEEAGMFHLWKYVTWLMGVPEDLIPDNRKDATVFFYRWTKYQGMPDKDSLKLADALLNENTPISLLKLDIVRKNMGYIHKSVANYLLDDNIRTKLKVPGVPLKKIFPALLRFKNKTASNKESQIKKGHEEQLSVLKDYRNNIEARLVSGD